MDIKENVGAVNIHVINTSNGYGATSDINGYFTIFCNIGDSLLISSVQYENVLIPVKSTLDTLQINLRPHTYELPLVQVYQYKDYEDFKRAFIKLPSSKVAPEEIPWFSQYFNESKSEYASVKSFSPITYLYDRYSKAALEKKRYNYILEVEKMDQMITTKYNSLIVSEITGLVSKEDIAKFMEYCHLNDSFIVRAKKYELYLAILECYNQYSGKN
jgi:hypothetical protein